MKKTFVETLIKLAEKDEDIYLLTGDLGFSAFEKFAEKFPERFIDCGVAEQNMAGIAAGLALSGKKPYIYSIIPFVTMRCFEQIRNDICYQNLNVKIVGVGTGFSYGALGATHHATEDISIFRALPNITILSPADSVEAEKIIEQSYINRGPAYIRLDKAESFLVNKKSKIKISEPNLVKTGKDGFIIATGNCLKQAIEISKKLEKNGIDIGLISLHTLKPLKEKLIVNKISGKKYLFTIEEHKGTGGLADILSSIIVKHNIKNLIFKNFCLDSNYKYVTGNRNFLSKKYKLDENNIYKAVSLYIKNGK